MCLCTLSIGVGLIGTVDIKRNCDFYYVYSFLNHFRKPYQCEKITINIFIWPTEN